MDRKELLAVIKELNQSETLLVEIGEKKIVMIGKGSKTVDLIENFGRVMLKLDDAGLTDEISEDCIDFFEENVDEFMPEGEQKDQSKKEEAEEKSNKEEKADNVVEEEDVDEKGSKEKKKSAKSEKNDVMDFLSKLVDEGKYTRIEIVEKALEQFPDKAKNYFGTYLSDGKNPKYCKFDSLIVVDEEGRLSFEK